MSKINGSFLRGGAFPLEANYIFNSEAELKEFFNDPIYIETLHKGLLKVVDEDGELSLYWTVEKDGRLEFQKLLSSDTIALIEKIVEDDSDSRLDSEIAKLKGNPIKLLTLEELETALLALTQLTKNRADNLLTELDLTQVGVGLSGDGSYNSDKETYYLKDATSVMNALKILDRLIHRIHYEVKDTDTVLMIAETDEDTNSTTISANIKVSSESNNLILVKDSGLFHNSTLEYTDGILTHKINGAVVSTISLGLSGLIEDAYYDRTTETIVIMFKLSNDEALRVEIPAGELITEWEVDNTDSVILLTRERVIDGTDKLSADVVITNDVNNILIKKDGGLYVEAPDSPEYGVVTTERNGLMTKEDKVNLDELCQLIYADKTVLSTSGISTIEKGIATDVTISWATKFDNVVVTPTTLSVKKGSTILTEDATKTSITDNISDASSYIIAITYRGVNKTATKSINAYYPKYYGGSTNTTLNSEDILSLTKQSISSTATGTYSITSADNEYIWFCIPSTMNINKVTLGGFNVPLESAITVAVEGKGNYKCYRSSNPLSAGTRSFVIS